LLLKKEDEIRLIKQYICFLLSVFMTRVEICRSSRITDIIPEEHIRTHAYLLWEKDVEGGGLTRAPGEYYRKACEFFGNKIIVPDGEYQKIQKFALRVSEE